MRACGGCGENIEEQPDGTARDLKGEPHDCGTSAYCPLGHVKDPGQPCSVCAELWQAHVAGRLLSLRLDPSVAPVTPEERQEVMRTAYDWQVAYDGTVWGLTAGDQGWEPTGIALSMDDIIEVARAAKGLG